MKRNPEKKGTRSSLRVWLASRTCPALDSHLSLFAGLNKLNVSLFPNVISLARYLNPFRRIGNKWYLVRSRFPALSVVCLSSPWFLIGSWWRKPFLWLVHDDADLSYDWLMITQTFFMIGYCDYFGCDFVSFNWNLLLISIGNCYNWFLTDFLCAQSFKSAVSWLILSTVTR